MDALEVLHDLVTAHRHRDGPIPFETARTRGYDRGY